MKKIKRGIARLYDFISIKFIFPRQYKKYAKRPVDDKKVILLEPRFPKTTDSLLLIKKELERRGGYNIVEISIGFELLHIKELHGRVMNFLKEMATAKYVFTTDSNKAVGGFDKRAETKVIQVWHACGAFKKFGFSTSKLGFGGSSYKQNMYPQHRNYDAVTVSSPEVVWAYEEAMGLEGKNQVKPWGVSRTDVFFDDKFIEAAQNKVMEAVPESEGRKIILYAPTFRGKVIEATSPDELDIEGMKEKLDDRYVLLIKRHPFVKKSADIPASCSDFAFDISDSLEIDELLCASDICISDYSSLIYEYSLLEKPMIFFAFDLDTYFDFRGFYYDYDELTPGPVYKTTADIIDYIRNIESRFDREEVISFKDKFMSSCDGHATEKILEHTMEEA